MGHHIVAINGRDFHGVRTLGYRGIDTQIYLFLGGDGVSACGGDVAGEGEFQSVLCSENKTYSIKATNNPTWDSYF